MARVGLLEDNIRIAKLCVTMLNYAGHDVTLYMDAQECLQALAIFDLLTSPSAQGLDEFSPFPIDDHSRFALAYHAWSGSFTTIA